MADLYYYETGYVDESYFVYVADGQVSIGPYIVEGWMEPGYWDDYSGQASLTCIGDVTRGEEVPANGAWSSSASMSITATKTVSAATTMSVVFTQTAYGARERDIDMFAFTEGQLLSAVEAIKEYALEADAAFDIATDYVRYRSTAVDVNAEFSQSVINERSRDTSMETQAAFSLSADIDDLTKDADADLSSTTSLSANIGKLQTASAEFRSYGFILTTRYVGTDRPKTISGTFDGSNLINSASRITDLTELPNADNWFYYTQVSIDPSGDWQNVDVKTLFNIPLGTKGSATASIRYRAAQGVTITVSALGSSGSYSTGSLSNSSAAVNFNIAVSFTGGQKIAVYVNGNRVGLLSNVSTSGWTINPNQTVQFAPDFPYTISSSTHNSYTDYAWLTYGDYTNDGAATFTYPTPLVNTENTIFLYHFNGNGQETTALTLGGSASLQSTSSITARLSGLSNFSAGLQSTATISCTISHIEGADLTAFTNASLSATALRIQSSSVATEVESSQSATVNVITDIDAGLSSEFTQSVDNSRTRDNSISTESVATQLTAVIRLAGLLVDDLVSSTLSVDPVVVRSAESTIAGQFATSVDPYRVRFNSANIVSEASASVDADVRITTSAELTSNFSQGTINSRTRDFASSQTSTTSVYALANNLGKIECQVFNTVAMAIDAVKIATVESIETADTTLVANTTRVRGITSTLTSEFTETVAFKKTASAGANLTAFASELIVGVKTARVTITKAANATVSATAKKTTVTGSTVSSAFTETVSIKKLARVGSTLSCTASLTATGIFVTQGRAEISALAFEVIAIVKIAGSLANLESTATMSADISVIRSAAIATSGQFTETASIRRIRNVPASLISQFSESATIGKLAVGSANITSAMQFTAGIREIHIEEIVYVIPAEVWVYDIGSETRQYTIGSESREYIIT